MLRPATITLVSIVVSLGIFLKSAPTPPNQPYLTKATYGPTPAESIQDWGSERTKRAKGETSEESGMSLPYRSGDDFGG